MSVDRFKTELANNAPTRTLGMLHFTDRFMLFAAHTFAVVFITICFTASIGIV